MEVSQAAGTQISATSASLSPLWAIQLAYLFKFKGKGGVRNSSCVILIGDSDESLFSIGGAD